jgi:hypothetical protein
MTFVIFVMGFKFGRFLDRFVVKRMAHKPLDGNDNGFIHFVAHNFACPDFSLVSFLFACLQSLSFHS